jgi:NTE family protein
MKRVGLALGSGGARGWAHIGVIRALQEAGIGIDLLSGASIGAPVGAIFCARELDELEDFVRELSWRDMLTYFDMVFPVSGLLDGNRVYDLLSDHIRGMTIEDSPIPFCCVATDLIRGREVHLRSGAMVDAVQASISVPGLFTPFSHGDRSLGDGGIVNPVPVDVVRAMGAEVVIAVNLNRNEDTGAMEDPAGEPEEEDAGPNIFDVIGTSLNVMEQQVTRGRLAAHAPDLLVEPALSNVAIFDFHRAARIIREGHRAMKQQLPALQERL